MAPGHYTWRFFLCLILLFFSKKATVVVYNLLHHQGLIAVVCLAGLFLHLDLMVRVGLIFLAHSTFDRVAGYGLKYADNLDHTHLGWVGKSKHFNISGD